MKHEQSQIEKLRSQLIEKNLADRIVKSLPSGRYFCLMTTAKDSENPRNNNVIYMQLFAKFSMWSIPEEKFFEIIDVNGIPSPRFEYAIDDDLAIDALLDWFDFKEKENTGIASNENLF